jgi:glutathione S-transferase
VYILTNDWNFVVDCDDYWLQYLNILEKQLETNNKKGWLVGDKPSIADLRAHAILKWLSAGILDGIPTDLLDKTPLLKALVDKVEAIPQVVAFRAKYGAPPYKDFDFVPPEN